MNAKTRAHDLGKSGGAGKKEGHPSSPQFPPVLFSFSRFLNYADPTISEPGTGYKWRRTFYPENKLKRQESKTKSLSLWTKKRGMIVQMKGFALYFSFISWIFQNEILDCLEIRFLCTLGSYRISSIIWPHSYHVVRPVRAAAESPTRKKINNYWLHVNAQILRCGLKVAEHSFGSLWLCVICQIMARERLLLTSWNLAIEKCTDKRFWLTDKNWRFRSFHGNMDDWIQP